MPASSVSLRDVISVIRSMPDISVVIAILHYVQQFLEAPDDYDKAEVLLSALEELAKENGAELPEELITDLDAVLKSPQGKALFELLDEQIRKHV